jgi:hypothetical protein
VYQIILIQTSAVSWNVLTVCISHFWLAAQVVQILPLPFFNRKHGHLDMTEFWKPWCPPPHLIYSTGVSFFNIIPMHVGAFISFWSEHTKYVVVNWGSCIHTQTVLLPYFGIGDLPSIIWAAKQILPLMLCSHASFLCWSDGYDYHHGCLTVFLHAPPAYISISWRWILMGAFSWYNLIIRLHFFMTSRMPWHSGYWV